MSGVLFTTKKESQVGAIILLFISVLIWMVVVGVWAYGVESKVGRAFVGVLAVPCVALMSLILVRSYTLGTLAPFRMGDSEVYQVVSVYEDVSDRSRAIALLRKRDGEERHYQVNLNRFEGGVEALSALPQSTCFSLIPYDAEPSSLLTIAEVACSEALARRP